VSAFGFGGTNFHAVLEEHVPGAIRDESRRTFAVGAPPGDGGTTAPRNPLRGALLLGARTPAELAERLRAVRTAAAAGEAPPPRPPAAADLAAPLRLAIDYGTAAELAAKADKALHALDGDHAGLWRALRAQGVFRGAGPAGKTAFLYTGQGSQYLGMLRDLRQSEPVVAATFAEADAVMTPLLGKPLTAVLDAATDDPAALERAEAELRQTAVTQPAVLAVDIALTRLLAAYGIVPDLVMGHSLGEYGALVAAGCLSFAEALEAVAARGREMTRVSVADCGRMIAVMAPLDEIERVLAGLDGYAVVANVNSTAQAVVGGASAAVEQAAAIFRAAGREVRPLPVSHAFHTAIVAPASEPLRQMLARLTVRPPRIPVVANATGGLYPMGPDAVPAMIDLLGRQIASPVLFVQGLETLYGAGVRTFVEVGPKRALHGFVEDVLGHREQVLALFTNHPKGGDMTSFNQALCGLYAAGLGTSAASAEPVAHAAVATAPAALPPLRTAPASAPGATVVVTGAALGLPGDHPVFDDGNVRRILRGEQAIDVIPLRLRRAMVDKHITRLVKTDEGGGPRFEVIASPAEAIKLAARAGRLDLAADFGLPEERVAAWDRATRLAVGAGLDALRDAGIPLVMHYKTTTTGGRLPDRWGLPDALRDDTGVIFASAFPGYDSLVGQLDHFHRDEALRGRIAELTSLREATAAGPLRDEIDRRLADLGADLARDPYTFDRRFLFQVLAMGHSQLAELIGARGPNTQVNAACASTTQAFALAEDWIAAGRCRRVVVVAADDITSDHLLGWFGAGFLASGAAATDELVEDAALPFDRRRHGLLLGMGAAAAVLERADAARERGLRPICELLGTVVANSAFHGSRLDVHHIAGVMERLIAGAEERWGIDRRAIAPRTVFLSHETYTPARGGSAQAEVEALREVFGPAAEQVVVANTKGFTGHAMGVGVEDVVAVKCLETGLVPPVANIKERDPELGVLQLSRGGAYPIEYALRLGAGFGSQISMSLLRWIPTPDGRRPTPDELGYAGRIADPAAWHGWLAGAAGHVEAELEVVHRTLRVVDRGLGRTTRPAEPPATATPRIQVRIQVPADAPAPPEVPLAQVPADATSLAQVQGKVPADPPAAAGADPVQEKVLEIVARQTGYPREMLDLDLDLEADLGIDTVKQAETFAAIRAGWDIPRDENLRLRDFPTLAHAIQFVYDRRPDLAAARAAQVPADAPVQVPVQVPAQVPADATPAVATAPGPDTVTESVLALIAEKTGYPREMLDLDLDLEADLGIDTVKQAEVFAALRGAYDIPRDENLKLRDFPTLAHTIQFVYQKRPDLRSGGGAETVEPAAAAAAEATAAPAAGPAEEPLAAYPRRLPAAVLRPPLAACKPTGVTLGPGSRVVVAFDEGGVGKALAARLGKLGVDVLAVEGAPAAADLEAQLGSWLAGGPVQGVYWLPALDREPTLAALDLAGWREANRVRVKLLAATLRTLWDALGAPGSFLVSATRLGGRHGYDDSGAFAPLGGGVTGLTKAFGRERPEALVKAVDFPAGRQTATLADALVEETLGDPGAVEIGRAGGRRWTVGLVDRPFGEVLCGARPALRLGPDSLFVVTGAAGSIVSAIVQDLATAAGGGTFHLLDLAPEPDPADPDLARFASDREGLKRDLFERIKARGERATPALVEKELARLERAAAALAALTAVCSAGGTARYHRVDLRDGAAVAAALAEVRDAGRVDVLLHAAGLEISRFLPDKPAAEYDLVYDVKADGWFNLMAGLGDLPLGAAVVFSSVAGRFGNGGQTDYSAANDLLCKQVSALRRSRPETLGLAIDWTAWGGLGMATRGSIPQMMAAAGIEMLPPAVGIPWIRRELLAGGGGEVVAAGRLGALTAERDPTGGLDPARLRPAGVMVGRVTGMGVYSGLTVETTLDPAAQPFLDHHRIDGTPVLPGVMGIEAFAEAAVTLVPELRVAAVEDVEFLAPFKLYRDAPRTVTLRLQFRPAADGLVADAVLFGTRQLPGQPQPEETAHFRARVRLAAEAPAAADLPAPRPPVADGASVAAATIYRLYFHGPAYQVLDSAWRDGGTMAGRMAAALPPNHHPAELPTLLAPRLIELCFQTAGLDALEANGRMALPLRVDRVCALRPVDGATGPLYAVTRPARAGGVDGWVVDAAGTLYLTLSGYRTIELPGSVDPARIAPLRAALEPAAPALEERS
jgi:acyl transferase domain-containing protein/acyl carrier protein